MYEDAFINMDRMIERCSLQVRWLETPNHDCISNSFPWFSKSNLQEIPQFVGGDTFRNNIALTFFFVLAVRAL